MEWASNFLLYLIIISSSALSFVICRRKSGFHRLPPGPTGWPILGNMLDLGTMPHHTLAGLRHKYGDVVWLRLGAIKTMVILSSKAAAELFKNHDLSFADRCTVETMRVHGYNEGSLALAPYGPYWRTMRRLVTTDMFAVGRINETANVRRKCVDDMLLWIEKKALGVDGEAPSVHVAEAVFLAIFNMLGNLMLSRDLLDLRSKEGSEFFTIMSNLTEWSGHPNLADFLPWLGWLDLQRVRKNMERDLGKAMEMASGFVNERMKKQRTEGTNRKDFLDVLLEFEGNGKDEPAKISDRNVNIFILEIFMAGSETSSSIVEWAMTELLRNPKSMAKVKDELARVVGADRKVEESDIDELQYLQAVAKETLRLHPPIPFLIPRNAVQDTSFMGYHIPKNTQVLVNAWAIGRDPGSWEDPSSFKPERFLDSKNIDYKGQNFDLIPFGAGRRICVGIPLAHRVLHLVLGTLLHHFDWQLEGNVTPETMDMKEKWGLVMRKSEPLKAVPKKRPAQHIAYSTSQDPVRHANLF